MDTKNKKKGGAFSKMLGRKRIKATAILKKRANLVINLKKISKRRKK